MEITSFVNEMDALWVLTNPNGVPVGVAKDPPVKGQTFLFFFESEEAFERAKKEGPMKVMWETVLSQFPFAPKLLKLTTDRALELMVHAQADGVEPLLIFIENNKVGLSKVRQIKGLHA